MASGRKTCLGSSLAHRFYQTPAKASVWIDAAVCASIFAKIGRPLFTGDAQPSLSSAQSFQCTHQSRPCARRSYLFLGEQGDSATSDVQNDLPRLQLRETQHPFADVPEVRSTAPTAIQLGMSAMAFRRAASSMGWLGGCKLLMSKNSSHCNNRYPCRKRQQSRRPAGMRIITATISFGCGLVPSQWSRKNQFTYRLGCH